MEKINQKIELVANIFIILVALVIGIVLVQKYFLAVPPNQQARVEPKIGSQLNAPDVDWSLQPKPLVLALQTGCRFCNESAPFYKRVIETVRNKNVKNVVMRSGDFCEKNQIPSSLEYTTMEGGYILCGPKIIFI